MAEVTGSYLETNENFKAFKVCREKTRTYSDTIVTSNVKDLDQIVKDVSEEFNKCYALGDLVKKESASDPLGSYISDAVTITQQRIKTDQELLKLLGGFKKKTDFENYFTQVDNMNFAISFVKQQETMTWTELNIRKNNSGVIGGFTYFNIAVVVFVVLLFAKYFGKNKFTEERKQKSLEKTGK